MNENEQSGGADQPVVSQLKLVRHETPESILAAYWHADENGLTVEELLASELTGSTEGGEEITCTVSDELDAIKRMGFWGYATPDNEIHVWVSEDASPAGVMFFLGHEIGHRSGMPVDTGNPLQDEANEERRADEYGKAAMQAYEWLKELFPHKA